MSRQVQKPVHYVKIFLLFISIYNWNIETWTQIIKKWSITSIKIAPLKSSIFGCLRSLPRHFLMVKWTLKRWCKTPTITSAEHKSPSKYRTCEWSSTFFGLSSARMSGYLLKFGYQKPYAIYKQCLITGRVANVVCDLSLNGKLF